ncbi:MAG: hypothetical protein B7Z37_13210 [Verrucomicrobia bacterium 12-59-8]|nr:MAG: hypothetical protein B7Z37_13210 [Verrucomicrobia bacterium 12-59-8]
MTLRCLALLSFVGTLLHILPACNLSYGLPAPGYGYPAGLASLAPRLGSSGNYIYYPRYEAYYHRPSKQFYYPSGKDWLVRPTVLSSTAQEILATSSVPFQLANYPSKYHAQIKQAFPASWTPGQGRFEEPYQFGRSSWDIDQR